MEKLLVDGKYKLEKFQGKGGWTYVALSEVPYTKNFPFGWVKVRGSVDDFEVRCKLMPMGNQTLMLPVKAKIRKKIKKADGDWVKITLFSDEGGFDIPEELLLCLMDEPKAHETFMKFSESEQNYYINWIGSARKEETKIERLAQTINRVLNGQKFYDK